MKVRTLLLLAAVCEAALPALARGQACPVNIPHLNGQWVTVPHEMSINPISTTLLHTGKVLIVTGSENDAANSTAGSEVYRSAIWDPTASSNNFIVEDLTYDVFCSGTAVAPDGRPLVVGGTGTYSPFTGDNRASLFDPVTLRFAQTQSMADGRWYATATTLGDGRVMTFSGLASSASSGTNATVEIYDLANPGAGWTSPQTAPFSPPLYPRMALLPDGNVFFTGQGATEPNPQGWVFHPTDETWIISAPITGSRVYGSAVLLPLLPPSYSAKVANFGGNSTDTTEIIDFSASSPKWVPGPKMSAFRIMGNATLLPSGSVLVQGGSKKPEVGDLQGRSADLYDPAKNSMSSAGTASFSRLYHSTALLLPDATVMSVGSNPGKRGRYEPAIEIYTPPYLFDANDHLVTNRPQITALSPIGVLGYSAPFSVSYQSASPISAAVLVRPGSTTHASDMDQRLIGLCGPSPEPSCNTSGALSLTTPPSGNIAPPGYYMLFLIDSTGVPSNARFLQLSSRPKGAPSGSIATPAADVTIPAGATVSFSTTSTAASYSWVFPGGSPATSNAQSPGAVTFSTPGSYTASLTLIDANGNSDPSPPLRTVTVLPASGDFQVYVEPDAQKVFPGGRATFNVSVNGVSGFAGTVTLSVGSETTFPAGVTSLGFVPPSITGSGTSVLTMKASTTAVPYGLSLTVTGTSGSLVRSAPTTFIVGIAPPSGLSALPSGPGQVTLAWSPSNGAKGYTVKRSVVSGGPYITVACVSTTGFIDTGLATGTTYYYVVAADYTGGPNKGGGSADSAEVNAIP
jgi:PKD repeat protein